MAMLTDEQLLGIEVSTRFSSVASILGSLFVVCTFLFLPYFRKSTARLILYATWGNMATNVATLVSTSAIPKDPARVIPLCEAQAFLIQWFMLADPFWVSISMAGDQIPLTRIGVLRGLERLAHLHIEM
jgi:hypothetical protein